MASLVQIECGWIHHTCLTPPRFLHSIKSIIGAFLDSSNPTFFSKRTSLVPSPSPNNGINCIWVGMLPKVAKEYSKIASSAPMPKKGQSIVQMQNSTVIDHEEYALKVVVILKHAQNKFYALLEAEGTLPEAHRIDLDSVFFFATFRDDTITQREKRAEAWSRKIRSFRTEITKKPQKKKVNI